MIASRLAILIIAAILSMPAHGQCADEIRASGESAERSIYSYDENNAPLVFFFPKETARWDGSRVTMKEWYMLTSLQKQKFISEYIADLERQYRQSITVMGLDYLEALNAFSYYSDGKAMDEPPTKFIEKLLDGQGKLPAAGSTATDAPEKSQ